MKQNNPPSAESAGNDENPEDEFEFIGTRGLSDRLLEDVTELITKYVKALPNAVDCDREDESEFIGTRGLSDRLLEDVTELITKHVKALPNAVDCDREVESQFFQGKWHQYRQHLREGTLPEGFDPHSYD